MSQNIGFNPDMSGEGPGGPKYSSTNPNWSGSVDTSQGKSQPPPYSPTAPPIPNSRQTQYQMNPQST